MRCSRLLLLIFCFALPLGAQGSPAQTTFAAANQLFVVVPNQPLYCATIPVEQGQQRLGVARMFEFQLPLTARLGQVGVSADGRARYLFVYSDRAGVPHVERNTASVHFRANGSVEVGRQSWELVRADGLESPRNVYGLREDEGAAALELARHLAGRCPTGR